MSKGLFFNSVSGDRLYNASDFAEYFKGFFTNGVFYNSSDALKVSASGNQVVIAKVIADSIGENPAYENVVRISDELNISIEETYGYLRLYKYMQTQMML